MKRDGRRGSLSRTLASIVVCGTASVGCGHMVHMPAPRYTAPESGVGVVGPGSRGFGGAGPDPGLFVGGGPDDGIIAVVSIPIGWSPSLGWVIECRYPPCPDLPGEMPPVTAPPVPARPTRR